MSNEETKWGNVGKLGIPGAFIAAGTDPRIEIHVPTPQIMLDPAEVHVLLASTVSRITKPPKQGTEVAASSHELFEPVLSSCATYFNVIIVPLWQQRPTITTRTNTRNVRQITLKDIMVLE